MQRERNPVSKALRCLELILEARDSEVGVRELAAAMEISPSSAHRVLNGLLDDGYVIRDEATQRYGVGVRFLRLTFLSADRMAIRNLAVEAMRSLVQDRNETAFLRLYDSSRRQMLLVAAMESSHPLRYSLELNEWTPIHTGATGLAILAFLPEAEREAILAGPLERLTPDTITDPKILIPMLERVRHEGYALSRGQRIVGGVAIAAPIFSASRTVMGSFGLLMPEHRFDEKSRASMIASVMDAAAGIMRTIGGMPPV